MDSNMGWSCFNGINNPASCSYTVKITINIFKTFYAWVSRTCVQLSAVQGVSRQTESGLNSWVCVRCINGRPLSSTDRFSFLLKKPSHFPGLSRNSCCSALVLFVFFYPPFFSAPVLQLLIRLKPRVKIKVILSCLPNIWQHTRLSCTFISSKSIPWDHLFSS